MNVQYDDAGTYRCTASNTNDGSTDTYEDLVLVVECTSALSLHIYLRRRRLCFHFGLFVCLFVSVRRITEKVVNGFWRNFLEG